MFFKSNKTTDNEFARVIGWDPQWSTGAPMPHVFSNGHKVYLIYLVNVVDPNWDGTYVRGIDSTSDEQYPLALVEFAGHTFRFGIANDEVFSGLSLWGKGLEFYNAHIIENSKWLKELDDINKVHPNYDKNRRAQNGNKHFMLLFHDEIFEIIASSYQVELFNTSFKELTIEVARRMTS